MIYFMQIGEGGIFVEINNGNRRIGRPNCFPQSIRKLPFFLMTWNDYLKHVKFVTEQYLKDGIKVGNNMQKENFAHWNVLLKINLKELCEYVIIAELKYLDVLPLKKKSLIVL